MAALGRVIAEAIVQEYGRHGNAAVNLLRDDLDLTLSVLRRFRQSGNLALSLFLETELPIKVFDETIQLLKRAVNRAKLGSPEALAAIRRLDAQARALEATATGPDFEAFISRELHRTGDYGGRTVKSPGISSGCIEGNAQRHRFRS
jgi:hypothetical protein